MFDFLFHLCCEQCPGISLTTVDQNMSASKPTNKTSGPDPVLQAIISLGLWVGIGFGVRYIWRHFSPESQLTLITDDSTVRVCIKKIIKAAS